MEFIPQAELYQLIGDETLKKLVDVFYDKIAEDELLSPMFPPDKTYAILFQYWFLLQAFGGPKDYIEKRGSPMMRKRHLMFSIGFDERNQWVKLMFESMDEVGLNQDHKTRATLERFFNTMATKIVNKKPVGDAGVTLT